MNTKSLDKYNCDVCDDAYDKKTKLIVHLKNHILPNTCTNETMLTTSNNHLLNSNSNDYTDNTSSSSINSIVNNEINMLDKYGIIDLRNKIDNNGNVFLTQSNGAKNNHVININSGKSLREVLNSGIRSVCPRLISQTTRRKKLHQID